jgi:hypothetical protein
MDEALAEQQREAYKMPGVDDEEPALDPSKKRKAVEAENVSSTINPQCWLYDLSFSKRYPRKTQRRPRTRSRRSASTRQSTSLLFPRMLMRKSCSRSSLATASLPKASMTTSLVSRCTTTTTASSTETLSSVKFSLDR